MKKIFTRFMTISLIATFMVSVASARSSGGMGCVIVQGDGDSARIVGGKQLSIAEVKSLIAKYQETTEDQKVALGSVNNMEFSVQVGTGVVKLTAQGAQKISALSRAGVSLSIDDLSVSCTPVTLE